MNRFQKPVVLLVSLALVLSVGMVSVFSAAPKPPVLQPEAIVSHQVSQAEALAALEYWTPERRAAAKPLDLLAVSGVPPEDWELVAEPSGPVGMIPGGLPDPKADALALELYPEEWIALEELGAELQFEEMGTKLGIEPLGYSYIPPYTTYIVNKHNKMWKQFPWKAMGKLYGLTPDGAGYSCSASVAHTRTVWTAGHCVYHKGSGTHGWMTNVVFYPAYRNGVIPYGGFALSNLAAWTMWTISGDHSFDSGIGQADLKSGMTVAQWVGHLGFVYNSSYKKHWHAFGYPGNLWSGKFLQGTAASLSRKDTSMSLYTMAIGTNQSHGASGGPWVYTYKPYMSGANNYLNGNFSYYYKAKPKEVYSPWFGSEAHDLWNFVWP